MLDCQQDGFIIWVMHIIFLLHCHHTLDHARAHKHIRIKDGRQCCAHAGPVRWEVQSLIGGMLHSQPLLPQAR